MEAELPASFPSARLKLARAREHADELRLQSEQFMATRPWAFELVDRAATSSTYEVRIKAQPPRELGVIVGDVVSNLRAALDHVIWDIAKGQVDVPHPRTSFPICRSRQDFADSFRSALRDVPTDARAVIEQIQPFKAPSGAVNVLHVLNEMSKVDKHRTLVPVLGGARIDVNGHVVARIAGALQNGYRIQLPTAVRSEDLTAPVVLTAGERSRAFDLPMPEAQEVDLRLVTSVGVLIEKLGPAGSSFFQRAADLIELDLFRDLERFVERRER